MTGAQKPATAEFLRRRALRILPAYYVVLLLDVLLFEGAAVRSAPLQQIGSHLLLIHNYSHLTFKGLDGPTWTMSVEAQFYVLLPLMAAVLTWLANRGRVPFLLGAVLLASLSTLTNALAVLMVRLFPGFGEYSTILSTPAFLSVFGMGVLCAYLHVYLTQPSASDLHQRTLLARVAGSLAILTFVFVALKQALGIPTAFLDFYFFGPLMGFCYAGLLLSVTIGNNNWARRALSSPVPRFLGDISFSLYLIHYPLIQHVILPVAARLGPGSGAMAVTAVGVVFVLLPLSFLCFWYVERPFLNTKNREGASDSRRGVQSTATP